MAIKDLLQMSASQLSALEGAELRRAFKSVSASLRMRRKSFIKHDRLSGMPEKYRGGIRTVSSFDTEAELRQYMQTGIAYMKGDVSTWSGYQESLNKRKEQIEKKRGFKFSSMDEFDRWGNFMGEMEMRLGASWKSISSLAWEMFDEASRLNINPEQLMKNFEYWATHLEELQEAEPLQRGRDLRSSDYLKSLKLEKISDYYSEREDRIRKKHPLWSDEKVEQESRKYSEKARKPSRGRAYKKGRKGK